MLVSVGFGNVARRDVNQKFRRVDHRRAVLFLLHCRRGHDIEPSGVAEFLNQQRVEIFARELPEEIVQAALQRCAGKTGLRRAKFQRELPKWIVRFQPAFRHVAQQF